MKETHEYEYRLKGSIIMYDRVVDSKVDSITRAATEKEAKSHVVYKWKSNNGYDPRKVKATFEGEVTVLRQIY